MKQHHTMLPSVAGCQAALVFWEETGTQHFSFFRLLLASLGTFSLNMHCFSFPFSASTFLKSSEKETVVFFSGEKMTPVI